MYPSVVKVTPGEGYVLSIVFDNGETGTLDMKEFLNLFIKNAEQANKIQTDTKAVTIHPNLWTTESGTRKIEFVQKYGEGPE